LCLIVFLAKSKQNPEFANCAGPFEVLRGHFPAGPKWRASRGGVRLALSGPAATAFCTDSKYRKENASISLAGFAARPAGRRLLQRGRLPSFRSHELESNPAVSPMQRFWHKGS